MRAIGLLVLVAGCEADDPCSALAVWVVDNPTAFAEPIDDFTLVSASMKTCEDDGSDGTHDVDIVVSVMNGGEPEPMTAVCTVFLGDDGWQVIGCEPVG